jgi:hypothetical protein
MYPLPPILSGFGILFIHLGRTPHLKFWQQRCWRLESSGRWHCAAGRHGPAKHRELLDQRHSVTSRNNRVSGTTPGMGELPVARSLPKNGKADIKKIAYIQPRPTWDSNPRCQCYSHRRRHMPCIVRPLWPEKSELYCLHQNFHACYSIHES